MKMTVFPSIGVALGIAFSVFFAQEAISAEKAQRLCLVNSPSEVTACRRGNSLYYQQQGLVHGKYLLDFAAQYCDTNYEINIQFPYVLCVYSGIKEKINAQEVRKKEIESNTAQGTGPIIQDGDEVTIRVRYPGKDGKPEKFEELKTFLATKGSFEFQGIRQGSSLIIASNGEKKIFEFVDILVVTNPKP